MILGLFAPVCGGVVFVPPFGLIPLAQMLPDRDPYGFRFLVDGDFHLLPPNLHDPIAHFLFRGRTTRFYSNVVAKTGSLLAILVDGENRFTFVNTASPRFIRAWRE
jgi:hypothetical protein